MGRNYKIKEIIFCFLFVFFFLTPLSACYSGLLVIPTTDFSGNGNFVLDLQWEGWADKLIEKQSILNTEFGIGDRFEFGFDFNLRETDSDHSVMFNAKILLIETKDHSFKIAAGLYNANSSFDHLPYVVASKGFGLFRTHFGLQREYGGTINYIVGIDKITENGFQFCVDKIRGEENYLSFGVGYSKNFFSAMLGYQWPNAGGKPEIVFHIIFTIPAKMKI
ncbi:MAG: hypothetical protein N2445_07655 [Acidobacteria bacterium]|nr:hypothetical protein [Acidobacteriota bacterium]